MKTCFFAYPSEPVSLLYNITVAVDQINASSGGVVSIQKWQDLNPNGNLIIDKVCEAINDCDIFLCELTDLNPNVVFELGYAIASQKRVWICVDVSRHDQAKWLREMSLLTTVGYSPYRNVQELVGEFWKVKPYEDSDETIYSKIINPTLTTPQKMPSLLYLKSTIATQESVELTKIVEKADGQIIADNKEEVVHRSLDWYIANIDRAYCVIAHLLDQAREGKSAQNSRYALLCGIAYGMGKPLLMMAHDPYLSPIDFRDILYVHKTARECAIHAANWLDNKKSTFDVQLKRYTKSKRQRRELQELHQIQLGEYVAEDEEIDLPNYYLETEAYEHAINTQHYEIFVGRKGSGKSALLVYLASVIPQRGFSAYICVIRPGDYDLEGAFELASHFTSTQIKHVVETLWRLLILTELARKLFGELQEKPAGLYSDAENKFVDFVNLDAPFIKQAFADRLISILSDLKQQNWIGNLVTEQEKISEILHEQVIGKLRPLLGDILSRFDRVFILIDNLDKTWQPRSDLKLLSEFLFGLFSASFWVDTSFHRSNSKEKSIQLSLLIFLRADIFAYVLLATAREKDKLKYRYLEWSDTELLQQVIEERILASLSVNKDSQQIWADYFTPQVKGIQTRDYITQRVIPRPRDVIYWCKQALTYAVNHNHSRIEEKDVLSAEKDYSYYAYLSLLSELNAQFPLATRQSIWTKKER